MALAPDISGASAVLIQTLRDRPCRTMVEEVTTREAISSSLGAALRPLGLVDTSFEGGAAAWGRVDEWSDRLECLSFVSDHNELQERYDEALRWFREVAASLG